MFLKYQSVAYVSLEKQTGLGLPSALFLILVMILIVASINQLNEMNALAFGREWLSMRAFYAAESGAQIGAVYIINPAQTITSCDNSFIYDLTLPVLDLSDCSVNVICELKSVSGNNIYTLTSTGLCGENADQATRVIQVRLAQ